MSQSLISAKIKAYEAASGAYSEVQEHFDALIDIGKHIVFTNDVLPDDLNRLARAIGYLMMLMNERPGMNNEELTELIDISAKISVIATRELPQRTDENNAYLLKLGSKFKKLKIQLVPILLPIFLLDVFDHLNQV